ncbi:hypothetical protein X926_03525 [Petrotoga sp. HWHPT.55.6.3]|nr:hypothetical protein X926_03525 [Petrotoga sp. HWHPT.55.6.3]
MGKNKENRIPFPTSLLSMKRKRVTMIKVGLPGCEVKRSIYKV